MNMDPMKRYMKISLITLAAAIWPVRNDFCYNSHDEWVDGRMLTMDQWEYKTLKYKTGGFLGGKINEEEFEDLLNSTGLRAGS